MDAERSALLKHYEESGDPDIADHLIESLDGSLTSAMGRIHFTNGFHMFKSQELVPHPPTGRSTASTQNEPPSSQGQCSCRSPGQGRKGTEQQEV